MDAYQPDSVGTSDKTPVPETSVVELVVADTESMITHQDIAEWQGRQLIDCDGGRIGKLEDVYFDVETEEPQFGTVKEGLFGRHLTFVPLARATVGPDNLRVPVTKEQVKSAPNIGMGDLSQVDESLLYHHYELNYTPLGTESGRRLARR